MRLLQKKERILSAKRAKIAILFFQKLEPTMKWDDQTKRLLSRFLFLGLLALMAFLSYKGM